jgi:ribosomal protein L21E
LTRHTKRTLDEFIHDFFHPFEARARREEAERKEHAERKAREEYGKKMEQRTHRELHKLTRRGTYYVFHDLPTFNAGNIDHLVVGPEGITLVETKGNRGTVEGVQHRNGGVEITVGGNPLHRNLRNQIRAQMWDVCKSAGMKTGPDDTFGMNWIVCFPNGELGHGLPENLNAHVATTADLPEKLRAPGRVMDDAMVESVASAVSTIYERPPSATPVRRPPDIGPEGRHYER